MEDEVDDDEGSLDGMQGEVCEKIEVDKEDVFVRKLVDPSSLVRRRLIIITLWAIRSIAIGARFV